MMASRRKRSGRTARRRNYEKASGIGWGILLVTLVIGGLTGGYFAWSYASTRTVLDEATLCPEDGPAGALLVLLDMTDPLTPQQGARLRTLLEARVAGLEEGTLISFGVVSSDDSKRGSLFSSCKPADGSEASLVYENPVLIRARFEDEFLEPLRAGLDGAMRAEAEDSSPIMESLQALIAGTPAFETGHGAHELVLVTDLLQNSETLSFYRGEGWDALRDRGGASRLARNLAGAWITVVRIPRPGTSALATSQVDAFWARYFDQQGARAPISMQALGDL